MSLSVAARTAAPLSPHPASPLASRSRRALDTELEFLEQLNSLNAASAEAAASQAPAAPREWPRGRAPRRAGANSLANLPARPLARSHDARTHARSRKRAQHGRKLCQQPPQLGG